MELKEIEKEALLEALQELDEWLQKKYIRKSLLKKEDYKAIIANAKTYDDIVKTLKSTYEEFNNKISKDTSISSSD